MTVAERARLRRALRSGDALGATRAWERLRLDPADLGRDEIAAARAARRSVGRAIRDARRRRELGATIVQTAAIIPFSLETAFTRFQGAVSTAATLLLVFALFVVMTPPRPDDGFAPAAAAPELTTVVEPQIAHVQTAGRGRTSATLAPVALATAEPTPQPTVAPTAAPSAAPRTGAPARTVAPAGVPGGQPGGVPGGVPSGTPGGVVGGVPGGTGTRTPLPSPSVYVLPLNPPTLLGGADRFLFRVIDSRTGRPLNNVCVIYGTLTCGPADPHTNLNGYFWLDLVPPAASNWSFRFSLDGYISVTVNKTYRARQGTVVTTVDLRRR